MNGRSSERPYLVDTSVWIEVLRPQSRHEALRRRAEALLADGAASTTGMIWTEVRLGARSESEWDRLGEFLRSLRFLSVQDEHWDRAARFHYDLRRAGLSVPVPDLLIAAVAMVHDAVVVHRDRHFDVIAQHAPLAVESYADPRPDALPD